MTDKEIVIMAQNDARAKRRAILPEDFGVLEVILYQQIYYLCRDFNDGNIPKDAARRLKSRYISDYGTAKLSERSSNTIFMRLLAISELLLEAEKCGCEYCKRIARIYDGRDSVEIQDKALHD